jgi:CubicO group peptidase (beta-lactamase class C family)
MPIYQLPRTPAALVSQFASGPLVKPPGKAFDYNNADFFILGRMLESVTGKPFDSLLREQILEPLGMKATDMHRALDIIPGIATPYLRPDPKGPYLNQLPAYPENWYAAGGMVSTAEDLRKFSAALYSGKLVSAAALKQMLTPVMEEYAFGQWVADTKVRGKPDRLTHRPGSIMGANTVLIHYLGEKLTVIVLSNTNGANMDEFGFGIAKWVNRGGGAGK